VVDLAIIIGPQSPPTLPAQAWGWLGDADVSTQNLGAAAAWSLVFAMAASVLVIALLALAWRGVDRAWRLRGAPPAAQHTAQSQSAGASVAAHLGPLVYAVVLIPLVCVSVFGPWPFPDLLPQAFTFNAWAQVGQSSAAWQTSLSVGLGSAAAALVLTVLALECLGPGQRRFVALALAVPLVLPGVLWAVAMHRLALLAEIDAQWLGLWVTHTLTVLPYTWIALTGAYLGFDTRIAAVAQSLGASRTRTLWRIKWPMLKRALASAFAVGFASSIAQYLITLAVGGGRFVTITTEAVSLSSGGARSLTAAFAVLQMALPLLVFLGAAWWGRPRFATTEGLA
jgi:putative thiamine transport system permease protein